MPLSINNYSAWVSIDGVEAECYSPEISEDSKTASCWIASESGKKFSVDWEDSISKINSNGQVCVDGNGYGGYMIREKSPPTRSTVSMKGRFASQDSIQPFTFSAIELTEDPSTGLSLEEVKKLGEISLIIRRSDPPYDVVLDPVRAAHNLPVYERAKKAGVHKTSCGPEEKVSLPKFMGSKTYEVIATFTFRYTSLDMLKAKGIVALPPPIAPPTDDVVIEILSDDEDRAATLRRNKKRKADSVNVKTEASSKRVKREPVVITPGDMDAVLDLTLD